jgi:hypothetical protein
MECDSKSVCGWEFRVYGQIFDEARLAIPKVAIEGKHRRKQFTFMDKKARVSCWPWKKKSLRLMTASVDDARPVFGRKLGSVLIVESIVCDSLSVQIRSQMKHH